MPEDAPSKPEANDIAEHRNLPVPLSRPEAGPGDNGESWLHRLLRGLFGRSGSTRSDIEVLLEDHTLADTGFSLEQRAMLKNILGLSERRVEDIMVPRADIVSVHQDIPLGELMKYTLAKRVRQLADLAEIWDEVIPEPVRDHTALESFQRGVLTVVVDSASHRFQLKTLLAGGLLKELRARFSGSLGRVRLVPGQFSSVDVAGQRRYEW